LELWNRESGTTLPRTHSPARLPYAKLQVARLKGSFGHEAPSGFGFEREKKGRAMPENFPPQKLPEPWLIDSEYLLRQLALIRELALKVPFTNESYQPTNTVVDAIWRLEEQLRYLLHLHREGQRAFANKANKAYKPEHDQPRRTPKTTQPNLTVPQQRHVSNKHF
jgi:hypothetical protein